MEEVQKIGVRFAPLSLEENVVMDLIRLNKNAFILLTVIALKIRHFDNPINGLVKGSCFLGDFSSYNLTEQEYRSAKKTLIKCGIIEVTATPKGTIAKLVSDLIYAYNFIDRNGQLTPRATDSQRPEQRTSNGQVTDSQRTGNGQVTTNIESKKEEKEKVKKEENKINSKTNVLELAKPTEHGNEEVNKMIQALKVKVGIDDFADTGKWTRLYAKHCVTLMKQISKDEFVRRLDRLLEDDFHQKNCNKIKYIYYNIKGFIEPKDNNRITFIS